MFITFEGGEGAGKSTQIELLSQQLTVADMAHITTFEPGETALGKELREQLLGKGLPNISPLAELFLFCADRAQHISEVIIPALNKGQIVLCDRFVDATLVYQGYARGIAIEEVRQLNQYASMGVKPDLTFLLDIPVEIGLARVRRRTFPTCDVERHGWGDGVLTDRFESENIAFHERVRQGYLKVAQDEHERFIIIDANKNIDEIQAEIRKHLAMRF